MEPICNEYTRGEILSVLTRKPKQKPDNINFYHGRIKHYLPDSAPHVKWSCTQLPRKKKMPTWLTATEFTDQKDILQEKAHLLAKLMKNSRKTVLYTGAGISTSAGLKQSSLGQLGQGYSGRGYKGRGYQANAKPNYSNMALTALVKAGFVHDWVQTNYDGLPQKSGCPQEFINEIRGSWYDPSNPVLGKHGKPRRDLNDRMCKAAETADLTLALGTSLSGTQTDYIAENVAKRSLIGECLGLVIVGLQQTPMDGKATLRIFSELDRFLQILCKILSVEVTTEAPSMKITHTATVPYDTHGKLSSSMAVTINLNQGQKIRLSSGHNWHGAAQNNKLCIGQQGNKKLQVESGIGRVVRYCSTQQAWELEIDGVKMLLGFWWLCAARAGGPKCLPVFNVNGTGNCH